jgi:hypothetical protein
VKKYLYRIAGLRSSAYGLNVDELEVAESNSILALEEKKCEVNG